MALDKAKTTETIEVSANTAMPIKKKLTDEVPPSKYLFPSRMYVTGFPHETTSSQSAVINSLGKIVKNG